GGQADRGTRPDRPLPSGNPGTERAQADQGRSDAGSADRGGRPLATSAAECPSASPYPCPSESYSLLGPQRPLPLRVSGPSCSDPPLPPVSTLDHPHDRARACVRTTGDGDLVHERHHQQEPPVATADRGTDGSLEHPRVAYLQFGVVCV